MRAAVSIVGAATAALVVGCSIPRSTGPVATRRVEVASIDVGRAVGADKRVSAPTTTFAPGDRIYASVITEGTAAEATLMARWSCEGDVIDETTERLAPVGTAVTEFHVFNPSGWKVGRYRVEIFLDGAPAGSRDFIVPPA